MPPGLTAGLTLRSPEHLQSLLTRRNLNNPRVHGYIMAISFGLLVRAAALSDQASVFVAMPLCIWRTDGPPCRFSQLPLIAVLSRTFKEFTPAVRAIWADSSTCHQETGRSARLLHLVLSTARCSASVVVVSHPPQSRRHRLDCWCVVSSALLL